MRRLIASIREIKFDSRNRIESLGNSLSKVDINNSIQFQKLNRKSNQKIESNCQDYYF